MSAPAPALPAAPAAPAIDSPNLTADDYRAIREGRTPAAAPAQPSEEPAAGSTDPVEEESQAQGGGEKPQGPIAKRFSELTGQIKTLKDELDRRNAPAPEQRTQPQPTPTAQPAAPAEDVEPDAAKFADYLSYQKEWNKWQMRQMQREDAVKAEQTRRTQAMQAKRSAWDESVKSATTKHADFREVAQHKDLPVTPAMADAITDSTIGTDILYHLGKNPDEAKRIAALSPVAQIREIGKLEVKLTPAPAETDDEPPEQPVSRAPKPIRPISVAAGVTSSANLMSDKSLQSMSAEDYRNYREARKIK